MTTSVEPVSKQKKSNEAKAKAVSASTRFKHSYKVAKAGVEDIKKRDKQTRRFKEPLVAAQYTELVYNTEGNLQHGVPDNPWGGDIATMEDTFEEYRDNPKNKIVWEEERESVTRNIDITRGWYNRMRETQWIAETEHGVPPRHFLYEQQIMNQLTAEKESIKSTAETSTDITL